MVTMRRTSFALAVLALSLTHAPHALAKRADSERALAPVPPKKAKEADKPESAPVPPRASVGKKRKDSDKKPKAEAPCYAPEVHLVRKRGDELEERSLHLTMCDGTPNTSAVDSLSVLARPRPVERPLLPEIKAYQRLSLDKGPAEKRRKPDHLTEHVLRVNAGLTARLQKVAAHFPGKTIEIISGHRPDARDTSRHHHGRALDIRVEGVSREALRDFLRTLDETGVGYYPNGYFVHVDVRDDRGYWVDRSGPGEAADYGPWPPRKEEIDRARKGVLEQAMADLSALNEPIKLDGVRAAPERARRDVAPEEREIEPPANEGDEMTADEVARIKAEALKALENL
jgi:hypothetical protein